MCAHVCVTVPARPMAKLRARRETIPHPKSDAVSAATVALTKAPVCGWSYHHRSCIIRLSRLSRKRASATTMAESVEINDKSAYSKANSLQHRATLVRLPVARARAPNLSALVSSIENSFFNTNSNGCAARSLPQSQSVSGYKLVDEHYYSDLLAPMTSSHTYKHTQTRARSIARSLARLQRLSTCAQWFPLSSARARAPYSCSAHL